MKLFELKAEIPPQAAPETENVLLERGDNRWSVLDDIIAKRSWVVGFFDSAASAEESWNGLAAQLPAPPIGEVQRRDLADVDWRDSYKAHFHAWQFGCLHWVPVWERDSFRLPKGDAVLFLDPGLAFGTGNHETTRLCVERLVQLGERRGRVIDAGCGSGILALSAARLGFRDVVAFDNDPEAVRVSEENAVLNGLAGQVKFCLGDLVSGLSGRQADVLMANILANVLMQFAAELLAALAPGGTMILSGILAEEAAQVCGVFTQLAPDWPQDSRTLGEWSDVVIRRPA